MLLDPKKITLNIGDWNILRDSLHFLLLEYVEPKPQGRLGIISSFLANKPVKYSIVFHLAEVSPV